MPKILIVDDEEINRLLLKTYLLKSNFEVVIAFNGEEALQLLKEDKNIDYVLTDIMMPKMNGVELLEHIKKNEDLQHIPVVAISAGNLDYWLTKTSFQFDHSFIKPISREELINYFMK
jgi:two-component system, chemotaxis family, sensor kinase CheA